MVLNTGLVTVLHSNLFTQEHRVLRDADREPTTAKSMLEELVLFSLLSVSFFATTVRQFQVLLVKLSLGH